MDAEGSVAVGFEEGSDGDSGGEDSDGGDSDSGDSDAYRGHGLAVDSIDLAPVIIYALGFDGSDVGEFIGASGTTILISITVYSFA